MVESLKRILSLFEKKEKKKLIIIFLMMIVAAIVETIGIGLIVPFVGVVTNPAIIQQNALISKIYSLLEFQSSTSFMFFSVVVLLLVFIFKNVYLLYFTYVQNKVILEQQVKLSRKLFREYLTKPYTFHLERNTAKLLRNVNGEVPKVFQGIIMSSLNLFTEVLVIMCILFLLLTSAPIATIAATLLLGSCVLIFFKFFRRRISHLGKEQQKVNTNMIKWVNQGLGASKEVKVSGKEDFFVNAYTKESRVKARNSMYMKMLDQVPRYFIETLLVSTVLITMVIIILQETDPTTIVSTMALFAMASFRIMPSINRVVSLITTIKYSQPALVVVYEDLFLNKDIFLSENQLIQQKTINKNKKNRIFTDSIKLNEVTFRYPNAKKSIIKDVSLTIPIGQSVAFVGESGAGKTTIVDLILGLYQPERGEILIDGKKINEQRYLWQQKIGYIPQTIFLSDDTIRNNVAFGIASDQIDDSEVWRALEQAQLKEYVESLPNGLETSVGERGVRLSGGQRQRIGIARALYHNPEILFMDEATSALDNDTEKEFMKAIDSLKGEKTMIIIAHRLSTIDKCDVIFKVKHGRVVSSEKKLVQPS